MKSQTKALLASVMVLALALSSIGGVTYSWFSNVSTADITFNTGIMDVNPTLEIVESGTTIECQTNGTDIVIDSNSKGKATFKLTITNDGDIPAEVTAKVVIPRYTAINTSGSPWIFYGEVWPDYDSFGHISGFKTSGDPIKCVDLWDTDQKRSANIGSLKFNQEGQDQVKLSGNPIEQLDSHGFIRGDVSYTKIRFMEYSYTIGDGILLGSGESDEKTFTINITGNLYPEVIPWMYIQIQSIQSSSITQVSIPDTGSIEKTIERPGIPIVFSDSELNIRIENTSLTDVKKISLSIDRSTPGMIEIILIFKNEEGIEIDPTGDVKVQFNDGNSKGTIITPASNDRISISIGSRTS